MPTNQRRHRWRHPHESYLIWKPLIWNLLWRSFKVWRPRGGALEPFLDFSSDCSRAPPRGRQILKLRYNKLQIKGFHMRYDSWEWRHRWRLWLVGIYWIGGALKPFYDFSSDCYTAPPRGRQTSKLRYHKLQIKGFHMTYDSWGWRDRWRHWSNWIYWIFWWVFSLFHLRNDHLRPKFLYWNDRQSHADLLIYKSEKMSLFDQKILEVAIINSTRSWWPPILDFTRYATYLY